MKITEITKGKAKLWAVRLEDDSTLWLHSDLLYGAGLRTGDDLTEERIADLRQQAAEHRAYEYGLYLLEKRGYSYRELYDRLMTAPEAQETAVLQALEKLTRYDFVNDARYA